MRSATGLLVVWCLVGGLFGCGGGTASSVDARMDGRRPDTRSDTAPPPPDSAPADRPDAASPDTAIDAPGPDAPVDGTSPDTAVAVDAPTPDASAAADPDTSPPADADPDTSPAADAQPDGPPPIVHGCGAFSTPSQWTTATGFRSAVVATGTPLSQPVAISFAGGAFGENAYVVDQGAEVVFKVSTSTGAVTPFVAANAWPRTPGLLTTSVWDAGGAFDGNLYIGDQGGDGDADSAIYRVTAAGTPTLFAAAPGPGLDDIFGLAFSRGAPTPLASTSAATRTAPASVSAASTRPAPARPSRCSPASRAWPSTPWPASAAASSPRCPSGGYSGDDTITRINSDGSKATPLVTTQPGIHAVAFARTLRRRSTPPAGRPASSCASPPPAW